MWDNLQAFGFSGLFQVLVLWAAFYYLFLFFRGTRGAQVLVGLVVLLGLLLGLTQLFSLDALAWLLRRFMVYLAVALLIIFQPEIRRALAELGKQPLFPIANEGRSVVEAVVKTAMLLARHRIGALIAIQGEIATKIIEETGVRVDARLVPELLASLFYPHTPLHDGGVIIRGNTITAAGCVFPLSQRVEEFKHLGTRHMAGLGLSEETDALVIIVSEETGAVSVAHNGRLTSGLDEERLRNLLGSVLLKSRGVDSVWRRAHAHLNLTPEGIAQSDFNHESMDRR